MRTVTWTLAEARQFMLEHQGLGGAPAFAGKSGILEYIRRVGCIQFDPLHVIARNPELVLQSRIADFRPDLLQALLYEDRALIDGMDKVMSIYPTEDWPYFRRFRDAAEARYGSIEAISNALPQVRDELERRGPLSSSQLGLDDKIDWAWAPARLGRAVLESMYFWGELVVHHKSNNIRFYDFARRCLDPELLERPEPNPAEADYWDWRVLRRIGGIGLLWEKSGDAWIGMTGLKAKERKESFERLRSAGRLVRIEVQGLTAPMYARTSDYERYRERAAGAEPAQAYLLAPLDNLIWDRKLVEALFGFDYTWEVYVPAAKRKYGYYVLPVLYGDRFVARCEPVRHRSPGTMEMLNWWWEPGVEPDEAMMSAVQAALERFMRALGMSKLRMKPTAAKKAGLAELLKAMK